ASPRSFAVVSMVAWMRGDIRTGSARMRCSTSRISPRWRATRRAARRVRLASRSNNAGSESRSSWRSVARSGTMFGTPGRTSTTPMVVTARPSPPRTTSSRLFVVLAGGQEGVLPAVHGRRPGVVRLANEGQAEAADPDDALHDADGNVLGLEPGSL